jgi:hypothetical protein
VGQPYTSPVLGIHARVSKAPIKQRLEEEDKEPYTSSTMSSSFRIEAKITDDGQVVPSCGRMK